MFGSQEISVSDFALLKIRVGIFERELKEESKFRERTLRAITKGGSPRQILARIAEYVYLD